MDSDEFPFQFRSILMKSQTRWTHSILCFIHVVLLGNPCEIDDYKDLNQGDRSESYKDATDKCDGEDLKDEWHYWYIVSGNAGNALATNNAPAQGSCGTTNRLYLKDNHPSLSDGEVTLRLCIAEGNKACKYESSIQVINCGSFYLYKLFNYGECGSKPWRYCTNGIGKYIEPIGVFQWKCAKAFSGFKFAIRELILDQWKFWVNDFGEDFFVGRGDKIATEEGEKERKVELSCFLPFPNKVIFQIVDPTSMQNACHV